MANREQLRQRVYNRCGLDTADGMATPTKVNEAINEALHFIETVRPWWWLDAVETLATVAGTAEVAVSTSSQRTRSVSYATEGGTLQQVVIAVIDAESAASGKPQIYAVDGVNLVLYPTPDAVYSLKHRFVTTEQDLTQDSDEPLLPSSYHPAVVDYASHLVLTRTHDPERARERLDSYMTWESRMLDNARRGTAPKVPRIREGSAL